MRYKLLGNSGLRVSEIALGTLNFGEAKSWGASAAEATVIMTSFADHGGVLLDTAPNYAQGAAEKLVGDFVKSNRDGFVLSTKYTANLNKHILSGGNSARSMIRSVEASLKRLGTDYIDILWLHYWDGTTPLREILKSFDALISSGKIRYFGFSDTPAWLVSRAVTMAEAMGWAVPIAIQVEYSLAAREAERELLPMAEALGLGALCWGPLAAGALAGGADPQRRTAENVPPHIRAVAEKLGQLAKATGQAPAALALRWLLRRAAHPNLIPIIGARNVSQLQDTLEQAAGELDAGLEKALSELNPAALGFPHDLIASSYLRRLALGDPASLQSPHAPRS